MKIFLATLMIPLLSHLSAATSAADADAPAKHTVQCQVITTDGKTFEVVTEKVDGDATVQVTAEVMVVVAGDGDEEGQHVVLRRFGAPHMGNVFVVGEGEAVGGGYLGVSIGEVPEVLASQFDLGSRGVLVLNVVDDSPADEGGIERHDIIVSLDGKTVDDEVSSLVNLIRAHEPGDEVAIGVLRGGTNRTIVVNLGAREEVAKKLEWKFEFDPDAQIEEHIEARGRMLMKDDDGNWTIQNLGDVHEAFLHLLPEMGTFKTKVYVDGETKMIERHADHDCMTITIKQDGDGEITVERIGSDGEKQVKVYADRDALAQDDEEAVRFFSFGDQHGALGFKVDVHGDIDVDLDDLHEHLAELGIELDGKLAGVGEHIHDALMNLEHLKGLKNVHKGDGFQWFSGDAPHAAFAHGGKPKHTFHANEDGSIEVRIRKGDAELVRHYSDEADLARRAPALSEQYEELMELGEDD